MYQKIEVPISKVILIDDHALFLAGLKELLIIKLPEGSQVDFFNSLKKAKEALVTSNYNFMITDLMMPGEDVRDFIFLSKKKYPDLIIIIVSSITDAATVKDFLSMGINGFLSKSAGHRELQMAFETTYNGSTYISSDITGKLAKSILSIENNTLTRKELEVLRFIAAGHNTRKVAELLNISPVTVMTHKRSLLKKLNLHTSIELVKYAYENNLN